MECLDVRERLSAYVDDALDERSLEAVEAHLEGCTECRSEAAALRALVAAAREVEPVEPPAGLKSAILQAARSAETCGRVADLLSAYVDGELDRSERELVHTHVAECDHCADELRALEAVAGAAAEIAPLDPPLGLRARIAAATTGRDVSTATAVWDALRSLIAPRRWYWVGGTAAAAAIVAGLVFVAPSGREPLRSARVPRPKPIPSAVSRAPAPETNEPVVVAEGLPATPEATAAGPARVRTKRPSRTAPAVLVKETEPVVPRPVPKPAIERETPETEGVTDEVESVPEADEVIASAKTMPAPAPPIKSEVAQAKPALIKVASAPVVSEKDTDSLMQRAKAKAAMRSREGRTLGVSLFSARF